VAVAGLLALTLGALAGVDVAAQEPAPPQTPRAAAPIDLTGQWVSVVTEEWRWRMVTPPKGDFSSIPLNDAGRKLGEAWDPAADQRSGNACRSYGAAGIMRMPGRVRISWQDDATLKLETDAGQQTRLFDFGTAKTQSGPPGWQGYSHGEWKYASSADRTVTRPGNGTLDVTTTRMRPGYLFKNGAPYSGNAVLTEHYQRHNEPNGEEWFTVVVVLADSAYLTERYVTSYHFKRETDTSRWNPTPCTVGDKSP
jgi:hypothetical protein